MCRKKVLSLIWGVRGAFLRLCLVGYFLSWIAPFTSWFHHGFFCDCSPHRVVSTHISDQQMKLQLPLHFRVCCAFRKLFKQGRTGWKHLACETEFILSAQNIVKYCTLGFDSSACSLAARSTYDPLIYDWSIVYQAVHRSWVIASPKTNSDF